MELIMFPIVLRLSRPLPGTGHCHSSEFTNNQILQANIAAVSIVSWTPKLFSPNTNTRILTKYIHHILSITLFFIWTSFRYYQWDLSFCVFRNVKAMGWCRRGVQYSVCRDSLYKIDKAYISWDMLKTVLLYMHQYSIHLVRLDWIKPC